MNAATLRDQEYAVEPVLYIAMDLSSKQWKLVFGDGVRRRRITIEACNLAAFGEALSKAKEKFGLSGEVRVVSCYGTGPRPSA